MLIEELQSLGINTSYLKDNYLSDKTPYEDSENVSLWIVELIFLLNKLPQYSNTNFDDINQCLLKLHNSLDHKYHPNTDLLKYTDEGFSRDNMIAVTAYGAYNNISFLRKSGITHFDFPRYLQPQDIIFFGYCAKKFWSYPLLPFLFLNMIWSCWNLRRCSNGFLDTDGKILSFVRIHAFKNNNFLYKLLFSITDSILKSRMKKWMTKNPKHLPKNCNIDSNHWRLIFGIYFNDPNHPINKICKMIWS